MAVQVNSNNLCDLAGAKQYLKITSNTDDDLITGLINACSAAIENYCRRSFKNQAYSEYYDGTGTKSINLKNYPVTAVTTVTADGVVLSSSNYICKTDSGILVKKGTWTPGDWNIKVDYTAGFTSIPSDLELACKMYVASIYKADIASFSTTFNEGFVFKADAIPVQVKMMLQPYVDVAGGSN